MTIAERIAALPWDDIAKSLSATGCARTPGLLTPVECMDLISLYSDTARFRSRVDMAHHRFGVGDYQYFDHPLPQVVSELRAESYAKLAPIANEWFSLLGTGKEYAANLGSFLEECHTAGQTKPTPLLLHYDAGGYNCLHQDLYGDIVFPLQMVVVLNRPGIDFSGGEFLMVEQRPRAQSIGRSLSVGQGEAILFTTRYRPIKSSRGYSRGNMRHGVSPVENGTRYTLGLIFHDAK